MKVFASHTDPTFPKLSLTLSSLEFKHDGRVFGRRCEQFNRAPHSLPRNHSANPSGGRFLVTGIQCRLTRSSQPPAILFQWIIHRSPNSSPVA